MSSATAVKIDENTINTWHVFATLGMSHQMRSIGPGFVAYAVTERQVAKGVIDNQPVCYQGGERDGEQICGENKLKELDAIKSLAAKLCEIFPKRVKPIPEDAETEAIVTKMESKGFVRNKKSPEEEAKAEPKPDRFQPPKPPQAK